MHNLLIGLLLVSAGAQASELPGDPTRPSGFRDTPQAVKEVVHHYHLSYLAVGKQQRVAVVNGQTVRAGDWVDGAKVLSISARGVKIQVEEKVRLLQINQPAGFKKDKRDRERNGS